MARFSYVLAMAVLCTPVLSGQQKETAQDPQEQLERRFDSLRHRVERLQKTIDDILWFHRLGDVAWVDKVRLTGPPPAKIKNKTGQGAGNRVRFDAYVFIPKAIDREQKHPLLVLPHGGVHSNFNTFYMHILRELMAQGYVVVAPEYRGSTGYGGRFYRLIDYGGLEVEDVFTSRNYMLENYDYLDEKRVGILGWSHGGLITLMNVFHHPDAYQVAFAGVPVSDLIARMGYKSQSYRDLYSADYHIGKTAREDVEEYRKRSPAWHAEKLKTPLLIYTNTNDEDVNVFEVEHLIKALKAAGKTFEYEVFKDAPGGHTFDRIDTKLANEARLRIYGFLAKHLKPANPLTTVKALRRAGYR